MSDPYPIATICGTMKLAENMRTMADELTRQGYLVLCPTCSRAAVTLPIRL